MDTSKDTLDTAVAVVPIVTEGVVARYGLLIELNMLDGWRSCHAAAEFEGDTHEVVIRLNGKEVEMTFDEFIKRVGLED